MIAVRDSLIFFMLGWVWSLRYFLVFVLCEAKRNYSDTELKYNDSTNLLTICTLLIAPMVYMPFSKEYYRCVMLFLTNICTSASAKLQREL